MEGEYTGHVKDGKLNGVGVCVYMDGSRYQGDWKQGLKSGRGTHSFASGAPRPNFLLLFVDDLGYNEVNLGEAKPATGGYTGYGGRVQTPAIAQLAAEGMVFTSWYSGWSLCSPSRAA